MNRLVFLTVLLLFYEKVLSDLSVKRQNLKRDLYWNMFELDLTSIYTLKASPISRCFNPKYNKC